MANKKKTTTTTTSSNYDIVKFCAFWGLVIAAIAAVVSFILALLGKCGVEWNLLGRVVGICNTISQIAHTDIPAVKPQYGRRSSGWR